MMSLFSLKTHLCDERADGALQPEGHLLVQLLDEPTVKRAAAPASSDETRHATRAVQGNVQSLDDQELQMDEEKGKWEARCQPCREFKQGPDHVNKIQRKI